MLRHYFRCAKFYFAAVVFTATYQASHFAWNPQSDDGQELVKNVRIIRSNLPDQPTIARIGEMIADQRETPTSAVAIEFAQNTHHGHHPQKRIEAPAITIPAHPISTESPHDSVLGDRSLSNFSLLPEWAGSRHNEAVAGVTQ